MQTIKFNTGRMYGEKGQRIAAALLDNGDIYFVDIDRGIDGTIRANGLSRDDILDLAIFTRSSVMSSYDSNDYAWTIVPEGTRQTLAALAETL
jgi:hypothetical protein